MSNWEYIKSLDEYGATSAIAYFVSENRNKLIMESHEFKCLPILYWLQEEHEEIEE